MVYTIKFNPDKPPIYNQATDSNTNDTNEIQKNKVAPSSKHIRTRCLAITASFFLGGIIAFAFIGVGFYWGRQVNTMFFSDDMAPDAYSSSNKTAIQDTQVKAENDMPAARDEYVNRTDSVVFTRPISEGTDIKYSNSPSITTDPATPEADNTCIRISNMGEDLNGLYKRHTDTLYVHTNVTKNTVLKHGWDNGWSGCTGDKNFIDPKCFPFRRWAFISDLSSPVIGNVNIWSNYGDSTGYIPCDKTCSHCYPTNGGEFCTRSGRKCIDSIYHCSTTPGQSKDDDYEHCKAKGYLLRPDTSCYLGYGEYYSELFDAQNACSRSIECAMVTDTFCDGTEYQKCKGPISPRHALTTGSCTWIKGCPNDISCLNGGTCVNGSCSCPPGFGGIKCEDHLWNKEASNKYCPNYVFESSVSTQGDCQALCEAKSESECVGISYSHKRGFTAYCDLCKDDILTSASDEFGFYRRPEVATIKTTGIPTATKGIPETTLEPVVYFRSNNGENCQAEQIIDTETICRAAANVLGLFYQRSAYSSNCPAGCHYHSGTGTVGLNLFTDLSETRPEQFGLKGGLCKRAINDLTNEYII